MMGDEHASCYRLPSCHGWHTRAACERIAEEHKALAAVSPTGDYRVGWEILMNALRVLRLAWTATGAPRCSRCERLGEDCVPFTTLENGVSTIHYCAID